MSSQIEKRKVELGTGEDCMHLHLCRSTTLHDGFQWGNVNLPCKSSTSCSDATGAGSTKPPAGTKPATAEQTAMAAQAGADAVSNGKALLTAAEPADRPTEQQRQHARQPSGPSEQQRQQQLNGARAASEAAAAPAETACPVADGEHIGPDTQACEVCGSTHFVKDSSTEPMVMMLCETEGCSNGRHLGCCTPPLPAVPEDPFFCASCTQALAAKGRVCMVRCRLSFSPACNVHAPAICSGVLTRAVSCRTQCCSRTSCCAYPQVCDEPGTKRAPLKKCTGRGCRADAHMACLPGKGTKGSWRCEECLDLTARM